MGINIQEERQAYLTVKNLLLQNFSDWWAIFCGGELSVLEQTKIGAIRAYRKRRAGDSAYLTKITLEESVVRVPSSRRIA